MPAARRRKRICEDTSSEDEEAQELTPKKAREETQEPHSTETAVTRRRRRRLMPKESMPMDDDDDMVTVVPQRPITFQPTEALSPGQLPRPPRTSAPPDRKRLLNQKRDELKALLAPQHASRQEQIHASLLALEQTKRAATPNKGGVAAPAESPASSVGPIAPLPPQIAEGNTARKSGMLLQGTEERRSRPKPTGGVDVFIWDDAASGASPPTAPSEVPQTPSQCGVAAAATPAAPTTASGFGPLVTPQGQGTATAALAGMRSSPAVPHPGSASPADGTADGTADSGYDDVLIMTEDVTGDPPVVSPAEPHTPAPASPAQDARMSITPVRQQAAPPPSPAATPQGDNAATATTTTTTTTTPIRGTPSPQQQQQVMEEVAPPSDPASAMEVAAAVAVTEEEEQEEEAEGAEAPHGADAAVRPSVPDALSERSPARSCGSAAAAGSSPPQQQQQQQQHDSPSATAAAEGEAEAADAAVSPPPSPCGGSGDGMECDAPAGAEGAPDTPMGVAEAAPQQQQQQQSPALPEQEEGGDAPAGGSLGEEVSVLGEQQAEQPRSPWGTPQGGGGEEGWLFRGSSAEANPRAADAVPRRSCVSDLSGVSDAFGDASPQLLPPNWQGKAVTPKAPPVLGGPAGGGGAAVELPTPHSDASTPGDRKRKQPCRFTPETLVLLAGGAAEHEEAECTVEALQARLERLRAGSGESASRESSRQTLQRLSREDRRLASVEEVLHKRRRVIRETIGRIEAADAAEPVPPPSPAMSTPSRSAWLPMSFVSRWFSPRPSE